MVLFIFFLSLLLSWVLLGMVRRKVGFPGLLPPLRDDDWTCAALPLSYFGGLAF